MKIAFKADASREMGTGHVMRCLALASALKKLGAEISFVSREFDGNANDLIRECGFTVLPLPSLRPENWKADADQTIAALSKAQLRPDWLVADHYALARPWEERLRSVAKRILVIDDLANRPHDADMLVDQNFRAESSSDERYAGLLASQCRQLLGLKYALLREEFVVAAASAQARTCEVARIAVCFGGTDPTNETTRALEALESLGLPGVSIDVIAGKSNANVEALQQLRAKSPRTLLHVQTKRMAELLASADLAIGAGGVGLWERACVGVPSVTLAIADNQVPGAQAFAEAGHHLYLGKAADVTAEALAGAIEALLGDKQRLRHFSSSTLKLVDGRGAERVARLMCPLAITLRKAEPADRDRIFEWRNDPAVRRNIHDTSEISRQAHDQWFTAALSNPARELLIGEAEDGPVGVLRFDVTDTNALVSIYLVPSRIGAGLGAALLEAGTAWVRANRPEVATINAEVLPENKASAAAFTAAGYSKRETGFVKKLKPASSSGFSGRR
ncbi:MAG: UDP-2,4-diacetamido-2,4,6-trideoxy-beta-L-altropyranose hydrolase [Deltaproteobacteria bacterium]|nr:UDP-2,4-diacetamido-2,4,6-trideoxy-beta-L-altropyranose hydrolase [Deltaproteobacteria bacterium]